MTGQDDPSDAPGDVTDDTAGATDALDDGGGETRDTASDDAPTTPDDSAPAPVDPTWPAPEAPDDSSTATVIAIAVEDALVAQEGLLAAMRLVRRGQLQLEDAAIVAKEEGGRIRIQETRDTRPAQGAASGSWLGMLATLFVAPGALLVGAALGAAAGGIFAKLRDIGLQDEQMKELGEELREGEAAVLLLVEDVHLFHAMTELRRFHGRVLHSSCDEHTTQRIADALADNPWAFPG